MNIAKEDKNIGGYFNKQGFVPASEKRGTVVIRPIGPLDLDATIMAMH